ncbi:coiled-coil domain-containing protein [Pseudoscourfieldia marina]
MAPDFSSRKPQSNNVVRVEMPFTTRCLSCSRSLARGLRFNAQKTHTGYYLTSPIYTFSFSCPTCSSPLAFATDPAHRSYRIVTGMVAFANKTTVDEVETLSLPNHSIYEVQEARDAMQQLEDEKEDKRKATEAKSRLEALVQRNEDTAGGGNDIERNRALRSVHREGRRERDVLQEATRALGWDDDGGVKLLPASDEDARRARAAMAVRARVTKVSPATALRKRMSGAASSSIFAPGVYDGGKKRSRGRTVTRA